MKAQDLFINEKYRPIAKTVGDSWEDSFEIRAMKNNDQDFLYYTGIEPTSEGEQHSFHHEKICGNADVSGDFFKPEDMIEYIEPGDWVKVINIKKSYSMYSQMFRKMGFNDKHSNLEHNIENGSVGQVFGVERHHIERNTFTYGVQFENGTQMLFNQLGVKKTKAPKATEDNMDFKKWASRWADENPTALVNNTPAHMLAWDVIPENYFLDETAMIDILKKFRKEYKSRKEWQPVTIEDHIAEVKKAGFFSIVDEPDSRWDFAMQVIQQSEKSGTIDEFLISTANARGMTLYTNIKDQLDDSIEHLKENGWTITPPPPKKWIVNAEYVVKFTEEIEAETEADAIDAIHQMYQNGDLENPMGDNGSFYTTAVGEIK